MAEDLAAARREVTEWSQTLEEKVVEKTDELRRAQRQVLHMEKMSSLGKLSATVAHELNNPISGMLNYTRLVQRVLADQPLDDRCARSWTATCRSSSTNARAAARSCRTCSCSPGDRARR